MAIKKGLANAEIAKYTMVAIKHNVPGCKTAETMDNNIVDWILD